MTDYMNNDPFAADDAWNPLDAQQPMTPGYNSFKTAGTNKLLVVVFVVDCSRSMDGDRISAVNAALTEVKYSLQDIKNDNGLDLKIAIMSFTSSAKWELSLTDIDEVSLKHLTTRPGYTEYGNAFRELNKVLNKEHFMKYTGKRAAPAIIFLTDGGPTDNDYERDLDELLKNSWFALGSRSVILVGDAINDVRARNAVRKFVSDPDTEIVGAEKSTDILRNIKLATRHTVVGDPMDINHANRSNRGDTPGGDPFDNPPGGDPFDNPPGGDPFDNPPGGDPFDNPPGGDPFSAGVANPPGDDPVNIPPDGLYPDPPGFDPFGDGLF